MFSVRSEAVKTERMVVKESISDEDEESERGVEVERAWASVSKAERRL